jgi:hypothetical protein
MPAITIAFGGALIALGLWGYFGTGTSSLTALIPAAFGLALVVCGAMARNQAYRKHAMHAAAMLGVLGFLGSLRGVLQVQSLMGGTAAHPNAIISQLIMAALTLLFTVLCVVSFINARKGRLAGA